MEKSIKNNRLFYTEKEFNLEEEYILEYLHTVCNNHIMLYQIDAVETKTHRLYNETRATEKRFYPKKELVCKINIFNEEPKFSTNSIGYEEDLYAEFAIPQVSLNTLEREIRIGDYARWNDRFYEIMKVSNITDASSLTKNYKHQMRLFYALMAKEDTVPKNILLNDNEIN